MQLKLFLIDSEVSHVEPHGSLLTIHLSAANVEQLSASTQTAPVKGYSTNVLLQLENYLLHECSEPLIGRISSGSIWIEGTMQRSCMLPSEHLRPIKLEIELANRSSLIVSAARLDVMFEGQPNFHESLAC